jgi:hypothetical protein
MKLIITMKKAILSLFAHALIITGIKPIEIQLNNARATLSKGIAVLECSFNGGWQGTTSRTIAR